MPTVKTFRAAIAVSLFVAVVASISAVALPVSTSGRVTMNSGRFPDDIFVPLPTVEPTATPAATAVPTPKPVKRRVQRGVASWYEGSRGFHGIKHVALQNSDWDGTIHGYVRVCVVATGRCTKAAVVDYCQCYRKTRDERIIDLSIETVRALRLEPSVGLYIVTVEKLEG